MSTTPGQLAKFDLTGNVTDSIITETGGGSIGIGTRAPSVRTQIEGTNDQAATLALRRSDNNKFMRLGVGTQGVALDFDPTSFLVIQKNTLGTFSPGNELSACGTRGKSLHCGDELLRT